VAQLVAQAICNRQVVGSSPTTGSKEAVSYAEKNSPRCVDFDECRSTKSVMIQSGSEKRNAMAEYLVLIYEDQAKYATAGPELFGELMEAHDAFGKKNAASLRGGNALQSTEAATSIRKDAAGEVAITDGAFAETKEALGGYYLIEATDLDEALAIAKQVPTPFGGVEVRPIRTFD
jgi:hypothetical protein